MATKRTNKKNKFNDDQIAAQIASVADTVLKNGVFSIQKNEQGTFDVINYFNKDVIVPSIPSRAAAVKCCNRYNNKKPYSKEAKKQITQKLQYHQKLVSDSIQYFYIAQNSESSIARNVNNMRLSEVIAKLKKSAQEILEIF